MGSWAVALGDKCFSLTQHEMKDDSGSDIELEDERRWLVVSIGSCHAGSFVLFRRAKFVFGASSHRRFAV